MAYNLMLRQLGRGVAILSATLSVAAFAQPDQQINVDAAGRGVMAPNTRYVSTSGLDLANPADRQVVERRIKVAANAVCDVFDVSVDRHAADFARCHDAALTGARAQIVQRAASNDAQPVAVSAS